MSLTEETAIYPHLEGRTNKEQAKTAIAGLVPAYVGRWIDEERSSALFHCLGCGQFEAMQLIPRDDGSIRAECLSDAACGKAKLEKLLREEWNFGVGRRKPARPKAGTPERAESYWELNPVGDAWRLVEHHGSKLLLVKKTGEYHDVFVLDTDTGIWHGSPSALFKLHSDTAKEAALRAAAMQTEGRLIAARSAETQRWLRRTQTSAGAKEAAKALSTAYFQMADRSLQAEFGGIIEPSRLNADKRYLGCANGILDLDTGNILPAEEAKGKFITRSTGIAYRPDAQDTYIDQLLAHLGDEEKDYLLNAVGYAVRGNPGRVWYLLLGPTGSGKTTFLRAVAAALGKADAGGYAFALAEGALVVDQYSNSNAHSEELKHFPHARIAYGSELPTRGRFNEGRLKVLTAGDDLSIRGIHEKSGPGLPATATIIQAINPSDENRLSLRDPALAARTRILPWPSFPLATQQDVNRQEQVTSRSAAEAMLAILVERAKVNRQPPEPPESVKEAVQRHREDSIGALGQWFLEHVKVTNQPEDDVTVDAIWKAAHRDLGNAAGGDEGTIQGVKRETAVRLLREVVDRLPPQKSGRVGGVKVNMYKGVRLLTSEEAMAGAGATEGDEEPPPLHGSQPTLSMSSSADNLDTDIPEATCMLCGGPPTGPELSHEGYCAKCILKAVGEDLP